MQTYHAASIARPAARLDRWNEHLALLFSNLTADPLDANDFDGRLAWGSVGNLACATAWAKKCRMHHGAENGDARGASFLMKVQKTGRSHVDHLGHAAILDPGDAILFDGAHAHRLTLLEDSAMLAIRLPRSLLGPMAEALGPLAGRRLPAHEQPVRLCADYADTLWRLSRTGGAGRHASEQAQTLGELLLSCAPGQTRPARQCRSDWATIERHLRRRAFEPDLSIGDISSELGMTPRWLQRIFAARGTTPGRYILDMRLDEARRRLADAGLRDVSITDIAFDLGFGDLTYFGRAFRGRYGVPPNGFRKSLSACDYTRSH